MSDREIVETLATKVMGWEWNSDSPWVNHPDRDERLPPAGAWELGTQYAAGRNWWPLTLISDAFQCVDKIAERFAVQLNSYHPGWSFDIMEHRTCRIIGKAVAETPCRAICDALVAAIAAIGETK